VLTLWDKVFLSFGSFSLLFTFKKKENEHAGNKQFMVTFYRLPRWAYCPPRNDINH
jgi:hypothetical protein